MAEFGAAATLEVTIPDKELRDAQSKIENELGDVSVNVDAQPSRQSPAAMSDGGFGDVETIMSAQLETLGDIHDEIEKLGASGGPGGGGGGDVGGTILKGLGVRSVLGGVGSGGIGGAIGGSTALGAGGIALGGGVLGKMGNDALRGLFPENFAPKSEGVSGTSYAYTEDGGIGGSADPLIDPGKIQNGLDEIELPSLTEPEWMTNLGDTLQLDEPDWVGDFDQVLKWDQPSWVDKLSGMLEEEETREEQFQKTLGRDPTERENRQLDHLDQQNQKFQQDSGQVGDVTIDVGGSEFTINPDSLRSEMEKAFENQKQEVIDEAVRQVENLLPDFGGF